MMTVLIVDDDRNLCDCLVCLIPWSQLGCSMPLVAYNGMEALKILREREVDFVLCDLKMPVLGGADLAKKIREEKRNMEIVFLSAYEDFETARAALQYGVTDYVLKPVSTECLSRLKSLIEKAVRKRSVTENRNRLLGGEYHKQITEAIENQDRFFLQGIFREMKMPDGTGEMNVAVCLLRILYEYQKAKNDKSEIGIYDTLFKKWCRDVVRMENGESAIKYVESLYEREMEKSGGNSEEAFLVKKIRQIVRENYCKADCNVAWIAQKLGMASAYIGRTFGKHTGVSLVEYITEYRMKKAKELLTTGVLSVNEVAQEVGYLDSCYFTKVFREKTGRPPSEYRRKNSE